MIKFLRKLFFGEMIHPTTIFKYIKRIYKHIFNIDERLCNLEEMVSRIDETVFNIYEWNCKDEANNERAAINVDEEIKKAFVKGFEAGKKKGETK